MGPKVPLKPSGLRGRDHIVSQDMSHGVPAQTPSSLTYKYLCLSFLPQVHDVAALRAYQGAGKLLRDSDHLLNLQLRIILNTRLLADRGALHCDIHCMFMYTKKLC